VFLRLNSLNFSATKKRERYMKSRLQIEDSRRREIEIDFSIFRAAADCSTKVLGSGAPGCHSIFHSRAFE